MTEFPLKQDEVLQHAMLHDLEILDSPLDADFDQLAKLAQILCETPIAIIGFSLSAHIWLKSSIGLPPFEAPLPLFDGLLKPEIINDAQLDPRISAHTLIINSKIKSLAVAPIVGLNHRIIGHLIVADTIEKIFTAPQIEGLIILAGQITKLLELRRLTLESKKHPVLSEVGLNDIDTIFRHAVDAVIITNEDNLIVSWNPKATEIYGWTAEEAIGQEYHVLLLPEHKHEYFKKRREQFLIEGLPEQTIEALVKRKGDLEFKANLGISTAFINGKRYCIMFTKALPNRAFIDQELGKQKSFYENILNKIPTDIVVFDLNHRYVFANPWAIKDDDLRKKIIGMDDFEYSEYRGRDSTVATKRRAQFLEAKNSGQVVRWEDSITNPEGQIVTHLRRIFPVQDDSGKVSMFIGFGIDITERKMLEERQNIMMKQLSAQNTQLLDFCNIVSHNLRGPLVNMSMLVEFIEESQDLEEIKMLTSKLNPVIENLNTTFNELVESIQVRQDLEIETENISLQEYLQRTLDSLDMEIKKSAAVFKINFEDAPRVNYPPKYLNSLFHNLVSNALKYHSTERTPVIEITSKHNKDSILLKVKDNGQGIDLNKHKDNVFKIGKVFHKHPNAKGLGLYMTKTQIEAMNGKIWVESEPDAGAVFYIVFSNQN